MNPLHPRHMSSRERLAEVCDLLALGLIRLRMRDSQAKYLRRMEKVRYTSRPTRAVMQNRNDGELHDRPDPRARGRAEDHADAGAEGAVARRSSRPSRRRSTAATSRTGIAYRIQELAYGGLKPETIRRLEILGEQYDSDNVTTRRIRHDARPVAGTRLVREYRGVEHTVTVLADGYEWQGRPYRSLSAIARAITGTRWNGLVFFGIKRQGSAA